MGGFHTLSDRLNYDIGVLRCGDKVPDVARLGFLPHLLNRISLEPPAGSSNSLRALVGEVPRLSASVRAGVVTVAAK